MKTLRKIEIFSAGCQVCKDAIAMVNDLICSDCEVTIIDMNGAEGIAKAKNLGVKSVPTVAVDGEILGCCKDKGPTKANLIAAGVGKSL